MHHCNHCKQGLTRPLAVKIHDHENPDSIEVAFCSWQCAAIWFNAQAGEILMPDLDHAFFGPQGPIEKWP